MKNNQESIDAVSKFINDLIDNQINKNQKVKYNYDVSEFFKKAFFKSFLKILFNYFYKN